VQQQQLECCWLSTDKPAELWWKMMKAAMKGADLCGSVESVPVVESLYSRPA
jgi:hypothetical protein